MSLHGIRCACPHVLCGLHHPFTPHLCSLTPREFNSYGARRGNDAVMTRGTFASIKLQNRFIGKAAPKTLHIPSGQMVSVHHFVVSSGTSGPMGVWAGKMLLWHGEFGLSGIRLHQPQWCWFMRLDPDCRGVCVPDGCFRGG